MSALATVDKNPGPLGRPWFTGCERECQNFLERVAGAVKLIHVMDREADSFELMNDMQLAGEAFRHPPGPPRQESPSAR